MTDRMLILQLLLLALATASCAFELVPESPSISSRPSATRNKTVTKPLSLEVVRTTSADFLDGPGRLMTVAQCTGCHSGALVRQYRTTRNGWHDLIRWMQKEQGLWSLDPSIENEILDYLSTYYGRSSDADERRRPPIADHLMPPVEFDERRDRARQEKS